MVLRSRWEGMSCCSIAPAAAGPALESIWTGKSWGSTRSWPRWSSMEKVSATHCISCVTRRKPPTCRANSTSQQMLQREQARTGWTKMGEDERDLGQKARGRAEEDRGSEKDK